MRTFIAIELPENVKKEIFRVSKKIRDSGLVSGNFVSKDNLHLTLRFLGDKMSEEKIEQVKRNFSDIILPKFKASTGKIGFFPSERYVRVIWIGLEADEISRLKGIIENKIQELGLNKETREFNSHITFARIKSVKDKEKFLKLVSELDIKKMSFEVDKISLIKSELTRDGPIYKKIAEFPLM
jgi:2'-5' RNA ligase